MPAFSIPWQSLKNIWMTMNLQKQNFYREVNPMTRVYTKGEMVLFSFAVTVGKTFYHCIPQNVLKHGDFLSLFWIVYTPVLFINAACFAEMAALMPAVGAHYHYCYSTICEFVAFLVGWNLIFAYTIITVTKCKFLSQFIDHILLGGWVSKNLKFMECKTFMFFAIPGYVDIISPILVISMAFQAAWAVKFTKSVVNWLTSISIAIIVVHVIAFTGRMDFSKMSIGLVNDGEKLYDAVEVVHKALVGYESLSVLVFMMMQNLGEEAKDPTATIPLSIMTSVQILMFLYIIYTFTMSICLVEQRDTELDEFNPLGSIVVKLGMSWLYWFTTIGTICSVWCSTYGSMFIALRILYAMSRDGMIFKHFSRLDKYTKKPSIPALTFGAITGFCVTFISFTHTIAFFSMVMAKIMTSICLLVTRYRLERDQNSSLLSMRKTYEDTEEVGKSWVLLNYPERKEQPTEVSHGISKLLIYNSVMSIVCSIYFIVILYVQENPEKPFFKAFGFCCITFSFIFSVLLSSQPSNDRTNLSFMTPYIPSYPLLAIAADFLSSLILCKATWCYGIIWTGLGIIFYFCYSIRYSQESRNLYADGTRWNPLELHESSEDNPYGLGESGYILRTHRIFIDSHLCELIWRRKQKGEDVFKTILMNINEFTAADPGEELWGCAPLWNCSPLLYNWLDPPFYTSGA